ncbi:hypothetical protein ACFQ77_34430 [Streptomyces virginiae]|uniref:hypothetical protein n=1 Tax=Streptomyces virginiae TaxID=1961 RepID=UPI0036C5F499
MLDGSTPTGAGQPEKRTPEGYLSIAFGDREKEREKPLISPPPGKAGGMNSEKLAES